MLNWALFGVGVNALIMWLAYLDCLDRLAVIHWTIPHEILQRAPVIHWPHKASQLLQLRFLCCPGAVKTVWLKPNDRTWNPGQGSVSHASQEQFVVVGNALIALSRQPLDDKVDTTHVCVPLWDLRAGTHLKHSWIVFLLQLGAPAVSSVLTTARPSRQLCKSTALLTQPKTEHVQQQKAEQAI